jgi:hypothetical protein
VRDVLNQIFNNTISYKTRGEYLILQKKIPEKKIAHFTLSGYVVDPIAGMKLPDVSIYEKKSLISTISNQYGFYKIKLSASDLPVRLTVSRPDYRQQIIVIRNPQNDYQNIELEQIPKNIVLTPIMDDNSIDQMEAHRNTIQSPVLLSPSDEFKPDYPEIIDTELFVVDSSANFSEENQTEWEALRRDIGQLFIKRSQRVNAENITDTLTRNLQVSLLPFLGTNRLLSGSITNDFSFNILAGFSGGVRMLEIGGLINGVRHDVRGVQLAGFSNVIGGDLAGLQISNLLNIANTLSLGSQISGGLNVVLRSSKGWQAGMINFAHKVEVGGKQIGLLNICDSTETTPIGLLSFVKSSNGYKRLELSIDESETVNFTFKTGVRKFYNVITLGYNFLRTKELFNAGYGIGRAYELGRAWMFNTDFTGNILVEYDDFSPNVGTLLKCDFTVEKQIARNAAITFGPTLKALFINQYNISNWQGKPFKHLSTYAPLTNNDKFSLWVGFQMGIRIRSR